MSPLSDVVLYENTTGKDAAYYPKQLAVNDYFIQDSRYLKTYANYFCRFVSAYREENMVQERLIGKRQNIHLG